MALTEENGGGIPATMLVGPTGGNFGNGFGGDGWWIILLFILLAGNNGWGGFGGGNNGTGALYPWMNQAEITTNGFQNAQLGNQLTAVQSDLGDIQTQLCNGFAGVNATINGTAANAEVAANARQMANMQQMFGLQTQFSNCCCENRLGIANLGADIAREACADRAAVSDGIRDLLANQTANTQRILDQLCADKIDAKNDEIATLRQQLAMKDLAASQTAQNAFISNGFANEVDALYNRLSNCPVPTVPVYGRQPIFTCGGCGCGNNAF